MNDPYAGQAFSYQKQKLANDMFYFCNVCGSPVTNQHQHQCDTRSLLIAILKRVERLEAALAKKDEAETERERCAKIAESFKDDIGLNWAFAIAKRIREDK